MIDGASSLTPRYSLRDRTILIISPNPWGEMHVSKHHYALELAERGNRVLFLEPPRQTGPAFRTEEHPTQEGLRIVSYRSFFPLLLRFHFRRVYDRLMRTQVRWLVRHLREPLDLVWCFETNLYIDLTWFGAPLRIYHPVDQVSYDHERRVAASADILFSVSDEILASFDAFSVPKHLIHHGLGRSFVRRAQAALSESSLPESPLRIGFVGNLLSDQLDRSTYLSVIRDHPEVEFHVWGPRRLSESNVAGHEDEDLRSFVEALNSLENVHLHGVLPPEQLVGELGAMHGFLLCYDRVADPTKGSNSHKLLEYLSTGRPVISSYVSMYAGRDDLMLMVPEISNSRLPALFTSAVTDLQRLNAPELRRSRIEYALDHSYERQIERIEERLPGVPESGA